MLFAFEYKKFFFFVHGAVAFSKFDCGAVTFSKFIFWTYSTTKTLKITFHALSSRNHEFKVPKPAETHTGVRIDTSSKFQLGVTQVPDIRCVGLAHRGLTTWFMNVNFEKSRKSGVFGWPEKPTLRRHIVQASEDVHFVARLPVRLQPLGFSDLRCHSRVPGLTMECRCKKSISRCVQIWGVTCPFCRCTLQADDACRLGCYAWKMLRKCSASFYCIYIAGYKWWTELEGFSRKCSQRQAAAASGF